MPVRGLSRSQTRLVVCLVGVVAAIGASTAVPVTQRAPGAQGPVFTSTANFVQTDVVVRDSKGRFVPGLKAPDFVVYEDGVRQAIEIFRPYVGGRDMSIGTGVGARDSTRSGLIAPPGAPADITGRVFIVFIDDLNFQFRSTGRVHEIMRLLKSLVQEEDLVGIVSSGYSSIAVDLTHDYGYKQLERAIAKTSGSGMDSRQIAMAAPTAQGPAGLRYMAHTAMRTVNEIVGNLGKLSGLRKSFIYISEGYDFDPYRESRLQAEQERYGRSSSGTRSQGGETGATNTAQDPFAKPGQQFAESDLVSDLAELIRNANRANVTFYTIDPRGLSAGPGIDERASFTEHRDHLRTTVDSLKSIAQETGGFCTCETNNFKGGLERINNATSDYYMLGYRSTNLDLTKRRRLIRIEMTPGLTPIYRTEYTVK